MKGKSKDSDSYSISLLNDEEEAMRDVCCYDSGLSRPKSSTNWDRDGDHDCSAPKFGSVEIKKVEDEQVMLEGAVSVAGFCRICLERDGDAGELIDPY